MQYDQVLEADIKSDEQFTIYDKAAQDFYDLPTKDSFQRVIDSFKLFESLWKDFKSKLLLWLEENQNRGFPLEKVERDIEQIESTQQESIRLFIEFGKKHGFI